MEDYIRIDCDSPILTFSLLASAMAMFLDLSLTKFCTSRTVDLLTFDCCVINFGLNVHS